MKRLIQIVWPLTLALLVVRGIYLYPSLPEQVASHFDASGRPDGWSSKDSFYLLWYLLIVFLNVWVPLTGYLLKKVPPSMISIPHRDFWLATEERKRRLADVVFITLGGVLAGVNGVLLMVFSEMVKASRGMPTSLNVYVVLSLAAVITAFAIVYPLAALRVGAAAQDRRGR